MFLLAYLATSEEKKILEKNDGKQMEREVAAKRARGKEYEEVNQIKGLKFNSAYDMYCEYICWAQNMDLHNPRKPWIHTLHDNPWIACAIHGSRESKGAKYKFADNPWIALRAQTTDCLVCSQGPVQG